MNSNDETNAPGTVDSNNNQILRNLQKEGRVAFVEKGNHDDYYIIRYAMRKKGDIISNDKFRDEQMIQRRDRYYCKLRKYLDKHLIHYTFACGDFLPNPDPTRLCMSIHHPRTKKSMFEKKDNEERRCCEEHMVC